MNCLTYIRVRAPVRDIPAKFRVQNEAIRGYIRRRGWNCIRSFADVIPDGTGERAGRGRLLERCRRSTARVDAVVIYSRDRLTRDLVEFCQILRMLQRQNIRLVTTTEGPAASRALDGFYQYALTQLT